MTEDCKCEGSSLPTFHVAARHRLHSGYTHPVARLWQSPAKLSASNLAFPLFIVSEDDAKEDIATMPGQARWGVNRLPEVLDSAVANGLVSVLLFGVINDAALKDDTGSYADAASSPVIKAIKFIKEKYPKVLIMTDLCLCGYTSHGHCGILTEECHINNPASIARLAEIAVAYAAAGSHVIAPSDMMDGRIGAIKAALHAKGFDHVAVMSYAAKFASKFYGPFRDAAHSGMKFGDRAAYQLPPGGRGISLRAVDRDIEEGADFVMVKPGLPYLDIVRETADRVNVPVAVYHVSGEYAMLYHAAAAGAMKLMDGVLEVMASFRRAGAEIIITYFAPDILAHLKSADA